MTKDVEAKDEVVTAVTTRELKEALWKVPANGSWFVRQGNYGHASIFCYDEDGNQVLEIRNKP